MRRLNAELNDKDEGPKGSKSVRPARRKKQRVVDDDYEVYADSVEYPDEFASSPRSVYRGSWTFPVTPHEQLPKPTKDRGRRGGS